MTALIQKDCIMIWKTSKILLAVVLLFAVIGGYNEKMMLFIIYAPLVLSSMSVNTLAYDEQSKWDLYARTMPYTPNAIVGSKFVVSAIGCIVGILLSLAATACFGLIQGHVPTEAFGVIICGALAAGTLNTVLSLPVSFWLGSAKGRLVHIFCLVVLFAGASQISISGFLPGADIWTVLAGLAVVSLALWAASYLLSVRLYQRRKL